MPFGSSGVSHGSRKSARSAARFGCSHWATGAERRGAHCAARAPRSRSDDDHGHDHDHGHGPPPARFAAGAAIGNITPPLHGQAGPDPADCAHAASFNGPRTFAFEEPYADAAHTGHYAARRPVRRLQRQRTLGRHPARRRRRHAALREQGGRPDDGACARRLEPRRRRSRSRCSTRKACSTSTSSASAPRSRADGYHLDGIFISATHDESAPDTLGISGVDQTTSGVDAYYVDFMVRRVGARDRGRATTVAASRTIKYAEAIEPANLRQCFSSYPFVDDQLMPSLQAVGLDGPCHRDARRRQPARRDARASIPIRTQRTGSAPTGRTSSAPRSSDASAVSASRWPAAVGSNETPEVFSAPISRTPQQFVDESHPAGCRTLVRRERHANAGRLRHRDDAARPAARGRGWRRVDARRGRGRQSDEIWGARRVGVHHAHQRAVPSRRAARRVRRRGPATTTTAPWSTRFRPTGRRSGAELKSEVAAFRIGDGEFVSVPGEVFPFTYPARASSVPNDMPKPQYAMPPWVMPHMHARYRFIDGLAEDMLGYIFPRGNGVGVIGEDGGGDDTDRFGCGHSDDSESTTSLAGDVVGDGARRRARRRTRARRKTSTVGRYVLPDGTRSRNPLGRPASIKCDVDTMFTATGPAIAIWLPGAPNGGVVCPAAWMSLSGRAATPSRSQHPRLDRPARRAPLARRVSRRERVAIRGSAARGSARRRVGRSCDR